MKNKWLMAVLWLFAQCLHAQTTITLNPTKDNSMFSESPTYSDGAGLFIYVGRTNNATTASVRRGLIRFDVSGIPANAQIQSAKLTLTTLKAANNLTTPHNVTLHKVTKNWGEGTSNSTGSGSPATTNDATWQYNFYSSSSWTTPGGDYVATESATAAAVLDELCVWTSTQMAADVAAWIASPSTNFGWMLRGEEAVKGSSKGFASKEALSLYPRTLEITYTLPPTENAYINELNPQKRWVEIYNPAAPTINLGNYWLANGASTIQITNSQVLSGSLTLASGAYTVLSWASINQTNGELAFYNGNPATGGTLMKDYIQYGSGNHQRAAAAVTAQVWNNAATFLPTITADTSSYSVNGNNTYASGTATNPADYLTQRQTPSVKNTVCPTSLLLNNNVVDAKYTTSGFLTLTNNLSATSSVKFFAAQYIRIDPVSIVPSGAFFEMKVGGCGSN